MPFRVWIVGRFQDDSGGKKHLVSIGFDLFITRPHIVFGHDDLRGAVAQKLSFGRSHDESELWQHGKQLRKSQNTPHKDACFWVFLYVRSVSNLSKRILLFLFKGAVSRCVESESVSGLLSWRAWILTTADLQLHPEECSLTPIFKASFVLICFPKLTFLVARRCKDFPRCEHPSVSLSYNASLTALFQPVAQSQTVSTSLTFSRWIT